MTSCVDDLGLCIVERLFSYIGSALNAPISPLVSFIRTLLYQPINISDFQGIWALIIYLLSLFYGLFILWAGFQFIISGYDAEKRENAKSWLRNVLIMMVMVQASYFLYELAIQASSSLTQGIFDLIPQGFFLFTADTPTNIGLEVLLGLFYVVVLLLTIILLLARYFLVAIGVILLPIGLFFYFIPFMHPYGKFIISLLLVMVFLPFFQGLILLIISQMINNPVLQDFKMLGMVMGFLMIDILMILVAIFALVKSAFAVLNSDMGRAGKMIYGKVK